MYQHNLFHGLLRQHKKFDSEKKFDAFLAYSSADSKLIPEFVERLEKGSPKLRLCFYERNWPVGEVISDLILHSVESSKRTIILMTSNFLKSDWARFELITAIKATSKDKTLRLIIIMYPDVKSTKQLGRKINDYLIFTTYLKRNDPNFWNKLIYAMPHDTTEPEEGADEFELMRLPT
ncbi:protein toll-like [Scaptodrosophila lebanonensis]|uniref:Protein toll-like n=1 Tax=Drosophila lebanonensis TaxID=7225 RepID=A0A6J2TDW3_DROLE|nr:protein toll-like [Scaptodrosophila lebanonensis]